VKLMKATPELACVWLRSRGWSTELRYQYRGVYIANTESVYQLPTSFLQSLMVREWRWDFLGSREVPVLTEEEALLEWQRRSRQRGPD
jgi:anti-sigma factor ChrR (cupin superfamily)